ncbi:acyl-CoA N-acyltransferase [Xylaria cubensis]|nr:acyl-CoA N-acyltransferase [Xylaria cubensis]
MSLPSNTNAQPSIRSFFRPKQPAYVAPPSTSKKTTAPATPPTAPPTATATAATATATTATHPIVTTPPSRPTNLHPQASISRIQPEHVSALRRITSLLLPVNYPDSFYARLSDPLSSGAFSRVILWRDDKKATEKVIGGLVCRPEPSPFHAGTVDSSSSSSSSSKRASRGGGGGPTTTTPSAQPNALYIQSLVLLSPYRGLGLAAALLDEVVADAARSDFACETVWAHVWTQNDEGLKWYMARGFARVDEVKKYYHKLHPDSAWIVRREIGPGAVLGLDSSSKYGVAGAGTDKEAKTAGPSSSSSVTAAVANLAVDTTTDGLPLLSSSPGVTPPPLSKTHSLPTTSAAAAPPPLTNRPPLNPLPQSGRSTPGQSFQNSRPETEWNDLPLDMQSSRSGANNLSVPGSNASSRSSSSARKKRDRAYPAAAFGK